jgi:hypothetical protein
MPCVNAFVSCGIVRTTKGTLLRGPDLSWAKVERKMEMMNRENKGLFMSNLAIIVFLNLLTIL